jgi:hypothetical protein
VPRVVNRSAVVFALATAVLILGALPAVACPSCGNGDITDGGSMIAQARSQMEELQAGYNGNPSPNCTEEDDLFRNEGGEDRDGNDTVEHEGYLRWVPDFENDPTPPDDGPSNEWFRKVCYVPGFGEIPGGHWRRFDAVDPEVLAMVAIDNMLADIPDHEISLSPQARSLVAIDTWFWIDGAATEPMPPVTAWVPGVTVVATAEPGGVTFELGDGTTLECEDFGTPYAEGATSDCVHAYEVAGVYTVTATIEWTGSYTVNDGPPIPIETSVQRTATVEVEVHQAQAVNTGSG